MLSQDIRLAKHLRHRANRRHDLIPSDEGVEPFGEVRLCRQASTEPEREPYLAVRATDRGQSDVVDLRVGAPDAASGDGYLEFSRQVVDLWIADKGSSGVECERRGVAELVGVEAGQRAARNVARVIATRTHRGQAVPPQCVEEIGKRLGGHPQKLQGLAATAVRPPIRGNVPALCAVTDLVVVAP